MTISLFLLNCNWKLMDFCVGTPVGLLSFVNRFMEELISSLQQEFQHLLPYPHQHDFLLMVRYCCNQKIVHLLLRHLAPNMLESAQRFDNIIDHLIDEYYDLRFNSSGPISIQDIPSTLPSLNPQHMACLDRVQLRVLANDGGLDLPAMQDIILIYLFLLSMLLSFDIFGTSSRREYLGLSFCLQIN
jgi:hypothetical protein